jgi:cyclopropane-fatty-acyl-phospholipid synthase
MIRAVRGRYWPHQPARDGGFPHGPALCRTLREWRRRFLAAADAVGQLGSGPAFQRTWNLYLAYSEAGFRAGYPDVHQLLLERGW